MTVVRASITVIQNKSACRLNNPNTAKDYLDIYITSALYIPTLKTSETSSRYKIIAPPS